MSVNEHEHFWRQVDNLTLYQNVEGKTGAISLVFMDIFSK